MDFRAILMGLGFALMWSSAFTSGRIIVQYAPPLTALAIRFLISGMLGVIIARMMGQSWRLSREQWQSTVIFGLCQNALYLGLISLLPAFAFVFVSQTQAAPLGVYILPAQLHQFIRPCPSQ